MAVYTKRISTRGRITIPPEIRQQLHLQHGDCLKIVLDNGEYVLRKVQRDGTALAQSDGVTPGK